MIAVETTNIISHVFILNNAFHPDEDRSAATPSASHGTFGSTLPSSSATNSACQNHGHDDHDKPARCKHQDLGPMRKQAGMWTGKKDDHEERGYGHCSKCSQI